MTSLLQVNLVKYECSCGSWFPLCQLYYCRKCNQLKCPVCLNEEIDIVFCPHCMENNSNSDAQQKKHRCNICHECPLCSDRHCYLQCNACQWTTRDSGIEDQTSSNHWPEHTNPTEEKLTEVLGMMKSLGSYEKMERSRQTQAMKRLSNLGHLSNDRFGLQTAYNMRKKALSVRPKSTDVRIQPTDAPELNPMIFTTKVDAGKVPSLTQVLNQPLCCESGQLLPSKVKLISRRSLRCVESDMMLYKGEYSPIVVKPRMQCFALDHVPDVRISRAVNIEPDQAFSFFIVVSNNSGFVMKTVLKGECGDDKECFDCSDFYLPITIPSKDDVSDIDDFMETVRDNPIKDANEKVTFTRRHVFGLTVDCKPRSDSEDTKIDLTARYAMFRIEFCAVVPPGSTLATQAPPSTDCITRVKVMLGNSLGSIAESSQDV
ncbi:dynactin p62 family domain-containing protein [Ditylenchus destructor]|nr:dynactin p62 family domain-containing protein [Ditylenchus destructor]